MLKLWVEKECMKMKIFAIVLIVFITESRFSSETSLEEQEEAVFQGINYIDAHIALNCYDYHLNQISNNRLPHL